MNTAELELILETYPAKIANQEKELLNNKIKMEDLKLNCKRKEFIILQGLVAKSSLPEFKTTLSNQEKRQIEADKILAEDEQYKFDIETVKTLQDKINILEIEIAFFARVFRAAEVLGVLKIGKF